MYHYFVRRQLRRVFAALNAGDLTYVVQQFHPRAEHWFSGGHAMAGRRTTPTEIAAWYRRLAVVFPGIVFTVHKLFTAGWPWDTLACVEWSDTVRDPGGTALPNQGVFVIRLRWGKAHEFHVYCDTAQIEKNLGRIAAQGVPEASAPPIATAGLR